MKTHDWIVIGGGITGSALGYELSQKGFRVLLLEQDAIPNNATRYSYGGLAYWSGTTDLTRKLCQEGINIHRNLSAELEGETEFRELDLLLTIDSQAEPEKVAENYQIFTIKPQLLSPEEASEVEPLLNKKAIAGALKFPHGNIHPEKTNLAYQQAFLRHGGEMLIERVTQLLGEGDRVVGVKTNQNSHYAANTVCCAGALSRRLLYHAQKTIPLYFTNAQLIKTPPLDFRLNALVMPATLNRLAMEAQAASLEAEVWDRPSSEVLAEILEAGAVQFLDGSVCMGQISQIRTDPDAAIDAAASEAAIRRAVGKVLPSLEKVPGTWHSCLVAFSKKSHFLVGKVDGVEGLHIFSGFTSPLVLAPPLARHFAGWAAGENDEMIINRVLVMMTTEDYCLVGETNTLLSLLNCSRLIPP